jgi:ribosomal protein L12E/L44/L45/RPP1/RPP2
VHRDLGQEFSVALANGIMYVQPDPRETVKGCVLNRIPAVVTMIELATASVNFGSVSLPRASFVEVSTLHVGETAWQEFCPTPLDVASSHFLTTSTARAQSTTIAAMPTHGVDPDLAEADSKPAADVPLASAAWSSSTSSEDDEARAEETDSGEDEDEEDDEEDQAEVVEEGGYSAYERLRLARIARNEALLRELGLLNDSPVRSGRSTAPRGPRPRRRHRDEGVPLRRSERLQLMSQRPGKRDQEPSDNPASTEVALVSTAALSPGRCLPCS